MKNRIALAAAASGLTVVGLVVALVVVPRIALEPPAVDHRTTDDTGVRASGQVRYLREFDAIEPDPALEASRLVWAGGSAVALSEHGVAGVGPSDGAERWRYRVPGVEVAVGFPNAGEFVAVAHQEDGLFGDRVIEVLVDPETGESLSHAEFPLPEGLELEDVVALGSEHARFLLVPEEEGAILVARSRGNDEAELWRVDPGDLCGGDAVDAEDVRVDAEASVLYLSVLCREQENVSVTALDPGDGGVEWQREFGAGNLDSPPEIVAADYGEDYGSGSDAFGRTLSGEFDSNYLYLDRGSGQTMGVDLWSTGSMPSLLPGPAEDTGQAPVALVIGQPDTVGLTTALRAAELLAESGVVPVGDFDAHLLYEGEDGSVRVIRDSLERSGTHALNLVLEALEGVEP